MIKYLSDRAVVRLTGVLTLDSVTALIESMEHAWEDCFHERLEITISSQGGSIAAYERLLEFIDGLRDEGVRVDTAASGVVGSAAAFLLSMGDKRRASPGCRLRYHLCRVEGEGHLTAADAGDVAAALGDLDDRIVARLAKRGVEATKGSRDRVGLDDFEPGDWDVIARIVAVRSRTAGSMGKAEALDCLRKTLDRCHADAEALTEIYRTLFAMDRVISPVLARELFLIDAIGRPRKSRGRSRGGSIVVPEWESLWPGGRVDRRHLKRHTLMLGETGSGKTVSGIMPLVRAMLSPHSGVGCALVIDPKRELLPAIRELDEQVRVIEPGGPGRPGSVLNLTATANWGLDADLEAGRFQEAATKILLRSAGLATRTPATVWAGLSPGDPHQGYWDHEGGSLAALALSLTLAVIGRRREIFAGIDSPPSLLSAPQSVRDALTAFAEAAGIVPSRCELRIAVERALEDANARHAETSKAGAESRSEAVDRALDEGAASIRNSLKDALGTSLDRDLEDALEAYLDRGREGIRSRLDDSARRNHRSEPALDSDTWDTIAEAVKRTDIYASDTGFRQRFETLDRRIASAPERFEVREATDRILLCGFHALDDAEARPSPNVMALAQRALDLFLTPTSGLDGDSGSGKTSRDDDRIAFDVGGRSEERNDFTLLASPLAQALKPLFGPEAEPVWQEVRRRETLAGSEGAREVSTHYVSILAIAQQAFRDFAAPAPAWTLYFGIEPYWKRLAGERASRIVDFAEAVDADEGMTVWVIQPKLGADREVLVAKAMKAAYFEAVLGNEARAAGKKKPQVGYVADEFHRFVTAGDGHGEQGFLDTCRSFGAFCALASQSVASIEHALAGAGGDPAQNAAAVSVLLNNLGTKLFFRTTDEGTIRRIRSLCPNKPGRPPVVDVRPPSTLAPGECYAALPDGRFERRQLAPCFPGESRKATDGERKLNSATRTGASRTRTADAIRLFEPRGEV